METFTVDSSVMAEVLPLEAKTVYSYNNNRLELPKDNSNHFLEFKFVNSEGTILNLILDKSDSPIEILIQEEEVKFIFSDLRDASLYINGYCNPMHAEIKSLTLFSEKQDTEGETLYTRALFSKKELEEMKGVVPKKVQKELALGFGISLRELDKLMAEVA